MSDGFVPYRVVLASGPLSPGENINTPSSPLAKLRRSGNMWSGLNGVRKPPSKEAR